MIKKAIADLLEGRDLSMQEAMDVMNTIMSGQATDAQIAGFLVALRAKGETAKEIAGCARAMRDKATVVQSESDVLVDTCGTGGDRKGTFNISTAAALVAAGAGARIAKHGNRGVSSSSGSADVLKELGVNIETNTQRLSECLSNVGIAFLYAPLLHGAMKFAIGPRRELGVRTIFNILGPLTNPARARRQIVGVYSEDLVDLVANALLDLDSERAMVVHGSDGMDEITTCDVTTVSELRDGAVRRYTIRPEDVGLVRAKHQDLAAKDVRQSADIVKAVLNGEKGPCRDVVLINAAGALYVAGIAADMCEALRKAGEAIDAGRALQILNALIDMTNR